MGRNSRQLRISLVALFWGWALISTALNAQTARTESVLFQELKENYTALQNARRTFARELSEGRLNGQGNTDYRNWIQQLANQVVQNCNELVRIHSMPLPDDPPCDQILSDSQMPAEIDLATETTEAEKTGQLIEQMNQSLGGFDERLLREQDRVRANKPRTDPDAQAGGGSGGGSGEGDSGSTSDEAAQTAKGSAQNRNGEQSSGKEGASQETADAAKQGTTSNRQGASGRPKSGTDSPVPDDIPDGSDDDIVARQLREAAEKEQDPELREKLWEEYRRYKTGTS